MKKLKERIMASFLVVIMFCSVIAIAPMEAKGATTYEVMNLEQFTSALQNANDGDVIVIGDSFQHVNISLNEQLEITKDITIHFKNGYIGYEHINGELEALVIIDSCNVTISGSASVGTSRNDIYAYKLVDTTGNASLTINGSGSMDDGILIVDQESNSYTSRVTIHGGSYNVPTERTSAFTFSNGTEDVVSSGNLVIYGGNFQEDIAAYIGENTIILDNDGTYEVRSTIMSDAFKSLLTDGKIIVSSPTPEDEENEGYAYLMGFLAGKVTNEEYYYPQYISDGVFDIGRHDGSTEELLEIHRVEVEYKAELDEESIAITQEMAEKIPYEVEGTREDDNGVIHEERVSPFVVTDMEVVNMWANGYDRNNLKSLMHTVNYSGELKEYLENSNVDFRVTMIGAGEDTDLYFESCGDAVLFINGMMGAIAPYMVNGKVNHIVYVPNGTANDKDALMAAAQKRINEYLGSDSKVVVSYGGAFNTLTNMWWPNDTLYQGYMLECLGIESAPEHYFVATSGNMQYKFLIMVDSSKMLSPTYKTVDAISNVSISSVSSEIPLDTSMRAKQLTSGEIYNKVITTLGVGENVTYDLKLFSSTMDYYVSELENGTFEVKIPLTDELKGKELVAYYIDENDEIEKYEVTSSDEEGYACFTTDHFSIYTVAEGEIKDNSGEGTATPQPPVEEEDPKEEAPEEVVPEVVVPETNVGGSRLEETPEAVVEKIPFTPEEKAQIEAGAEVKITLDVKDITETVPVEDKAKVEAEVKEVKDQKIGMYLDINMFKQVGNNDTVKLQELNGKVKIQFTVPDDLLVKDENKNREYKIVRVHKEETAVLDTKFDPATKLVLFETDQFSTYALVYKDVEKVPATGDDTSIMIWLLLLAVGGCAITYALKSKKQ